MKESFEKVREELKRIDHLVYVSLKYTRTVDVLRSVIMRLISAFDLGVDALLEYAKKRKKIDIPNAPVMKAELVKELYKDDEEMIDYINFYMMLRQLIRAEYDKREEYRRHVTMISTISPGNTVEVKIDTLYDYYDTIKKFVDYLEIKLKLKKKEEF